MKFRLLLFPILIAILIQACGVEDTVIIAGQVIDYDSGEPIEQSIIEVTDPAELQQTATSDSAGNFSFDAETGDETQTITLEVSKRGYETYSTSFKLASDVNVDDLLIELQPQDSDDGNNNGDDGNDDSGSDDAVGGEAGGPASLRLESISNQLINVAETGGNVNTAFTFVVEDSAGRTVGKDHEVNFEIIRGPEGGESLTPTTGKTNSNGQVTSNLFAGDSSGTVRIEARIERPDVGLTVRSNPVFVSITSGFPVEENFHISPEIYNFEGIGGDLLTEDHTNEIRVSLADQKNNPVVSGTSVYFWTKYGGIIGDSEEGVETNSNGIASVELRASGTQPTGHPRGPGFIDVYAHTIDDENNVYIEKKITLLFTTREADITANPTTFNIGNAGGEAFSYTVTDQNGYPMPAGTNITVEASNGLTLSGDIDVTVPDIDIENFSNGPGLTEFSFSIADGDPNTIEQANDVINIVVITPSGQRSSYSIHGTRAKTK
jgi:hypothetical protein